MAQFTVRGVVTRFGRWQRNIRVENEIELRQFFAQERVDTRLDWANIEVPLVTVSAQRFVSQCQPGDTVDYTIETWDRADGRRIKGIDLQVIHHS